MRASIDTVVSLALPPRCPGCAAVVAADHRFCATCWDGLTFLGPPWCAGCALPFEHDRGPDALCGPCLADPLPFRGARAAVAYGAVAKTVALRLKYGGRAAFAETAARQMVRLMPGDADLLVPVPLHRWRLWSRGYNQAALMAGSLARLTGRAMRSDVLLRTRATPVLRGLGGRGRVKALAGAFALAPEAREALKGRHVVLVDDVYTSGATTRACARLLLRGGAARVTVLCWARVVGDQTIDFGPARSHLRHMAKVEIYTKAFCPYCSRAMQLLASKGVEPEEYDVTMGGPKKAEMVDRSGGRTTMPQVFIDDRHIGGFDDMAALDREGKLDPLLTA